jgi:hypothetical protein
LSICCSSCVADMIQLPFDLRDGKDEGDRRSISASTCLVF